MSASQTQTLRPCGIEAVPSGRLSIGRGLAVPFQGWACHPEHRVVQVAYALGDMVFPANAVGEIRSDVRRTVAAQYPVVNGLFSGFWGMADLGGHEFPAGAYTASLQVTWSDGLVETHALPPVEIVEPAPPAPLPLPDGEGPVVAICMATYNPDPILFERQIDSIRRQTHRRWMCLIQDDGSPQTGWETIQRVVGDDPRFSVVRNPRNLNFYRNFEACLMRVPENVDFVALSDQDDEWYEDKLEVLIRAIGKAALVYSDMRVTDPDRRPLADTLWTARDNQFTDFETLLFTNTVTGAASLFRADLLKRLLPFPEPVGICYHDHWIGCVAMLNGGLSYVDQPLYDYVQHGSNHTGASRKRNDFWPWRAWRPLVVAAAAMPLMPLSPAVRRYAGRSFAEARQIGTTEYRRLAVVARSLLLRTPELNAADRAVLEPFRKPLKGGGLAALRQACLRGLRRGGVSLHVEARIYAGLLAADLVGLLPEWPLRRISRTL